MSNYQIFRQSVGQTSPAPLGLEVSHGQGLYLYDKQGRRYIDLISGICVSHLGHSHPAILSAIEHQSKRYLHSMVYGEHIQDPQIGLALSLIESMPPSIDRCFYTSSGAESIECAVKIAKRATGRPHIVSLSGAYHGSSHLALALNGNAYYGEAYRPLVPGIRHIELTQDKVDLSLIDTSVAGVVVEIIQGAMGCQIVDPAILQGIRRRCDEVGALLIVDEIQTGFHRTGPLWAFDDVPINPDLICLAKALGGGLPLGAVLGSAMLLDVLTHDPVLGHISTFGGHPLCCASGWASWEVLRDTITAAQVYEKETLIRQKLQHPAIVEIGGRGLMLGVHLSHDLSIEEVKSAAYRRNLLTDGFLNYPYAIRLAPPLNISPDEIDITCSLLVESIEEVASAS